MQSENENKLIAKLQHFYEIMKIARNEATNQVVTSSESERRAIINALIMSYSDLLKEYERTFQEMIYVEDEK